MLQSHSILHLHDDANRIWHHGENPPLASGDFTPLVLTQHRANFDLWHQEDDARSPQASDTSIAHVKHAIDTLNQRRNDLTEQIDAALILEAGAQNSAAPLHSESPGLIIDRLSILSLKIFHTAEETHRASASEQHRARNRERLQILHAQRDDLAACLDSLWAEIRAGKRQFRLYRQMKMYNDPELNPVLYTRS